MSRISKPTIVKQTKVEESQRMSFLPNYFGADAMIIGESKVYSIMGKLCKEYTGGLWDFYTLDNGGFFMAPQSKEDFNLLVSGNYFDETVSGEAAGIICTLFTLSHLSIMFNELYEKSEGKNQDKAKSMMCSMSNHFHALRDFVFDHKECQTILAAID